MSYTAEQAAHLSTEWKIEREARELEKSILDTSGDLSRALKERDLQQKKTLEPERSRTIDELKREAREKWLAMRTEQLAKEKSRDQKPEHSFDKTPGQSQDEERQRAIERWREYRRQELEKARGLERSREQTPQKERDHGQDLEGPEIDLGSGGAGSGEAV